METDKKIKPFSVRLDEDTDAILEELATRFGIKKGFIARRFIRAAAKVQGKHVMILSDEELQSKTG